jgi:hypothetical protein
VHKNSIFEMHSAKKRGEFRKPITSFIHRDNDVTSGGRDDLHVDQIILEENFYACRCLCEPKLVSTT